MSKNTKQAVADRQATAQKIVSEYGIEALDSIADNKIRRRQLREFAKQLMRLDGCGMDAARSHITKACRILRGQANEASWGGKREGAGRPATAHEQYIEHLEQGDYMNIMVSLPMRFNGDSSDVETFLTDVYKRKVEAKDIPAFCTEFQRWYRETAPDEYVNPEMENFKVPFGGY